MIIKSEHFDFRVQASREQQRVLGEVGLSSDASEEIAAAAGLPLIGKAPDFCFYCGERLTIPAVMWQGRHPTRRDAPSELWLHPTCAEKFVSGLNRDIDELHSEEPLEGTRDDVGGSV